MVGKRKLVSFALLAAACGGASKASNGDGGPGDPKGSGGADATGGSSTSGGSSSTSGGQTNGGSSSGGSLGGSAPTSGRGGSGGIDECPVTPASGTWVAYFGIDPMGFELSASDSELSGSGCLGGPPGYDGSLDICAPLTILADRGRSVEFSWDTRAEGGYLAELRLTLSPDRTAMAGSFWNSWDGTPPRESDPVDAVLVPYDPGPVPDATECSGGEPSGECFEHPLRADSFGSDRYTVAELGGGDLLLVWVNQRAIERRIAVARFVSASNEWGEPVFVDSDKAQDRLPAFSSNRRGAGLLVLPQPDALAARHYDAASDDWSEPEIVVTAPGSRPSAKAVFVEDDGDATFIGTIITPDAGQLAFASEYDAATHTWGERIPFRGGAPEVVAAGDTSGNVVVVWIAQGGEPGAPFEVGFSRRGSNGMWSDPAILHTSQAQILRPAVAIGTDGEIVATWDDTLVRASAYSPATNTWSQPVTVTTDESAENRRVEYTEDGRVRAYFYSNAIMANQVSELDAGMWSAPEPALETEALGLNYSVQAFYETIDVTRVGTRSEDLPIPALERVTCDGY